MKNLKKNKGVTLIALVITIIVLLILAGVALSMIMGDSGIFGKANSANEKTKGSQAIEDVRLLILEAQTEAASQNKSATLVDVMDQIEKSSNTYIVKTEGGPTATLSNPMIKNEITAETEAIYVINIEYGCEVKVNGNLKAELTNVTVSVDEPKETPKATYSVTYNANAGEDTVGNMPENQTKTEGETLELSLNVPTRDGYKFKGWATSTSGEVAYTAGANYTENEELTLYAVWLKENIEVGDTVYIKSANNPQNISWTALSNDGTNVVLISTNPLEDFTLTGTGNYGSENFYGQKALADKYATYYIQGTNGTNYTGHGLSNAEWNSMPSNLKVGEYWVYIGWNNDNGYAGSYGFKSANGTTLNQNAVIYASGGGIANRYSPSKKLRPCITIPLVELQKIR